MMYVKSPNEAQDEKVQLISRVVIGDAKLFGLVESCILP